MPVAVFYLFLVFQKIHIKRSPNVAKLFDNFFWKETDPGSFGGAAEEPQGPHEPPGHACPSQARPGASWALGGPPPVGLGSISFYMFHKKSPKSFTAFGEI